MRRRSTVKKILIAAVSSLLAMCAFGALTSIFAKASCRHEWDEGVVTIESTCMRKGRVKYTCFTCGTVKNETLELDETAHTWAQGDILSTSTCMESGMVEYFCVYCDEVEERALPLVGHKYEEVFVQNATCVSDGQRVESCIYCDMPVGETFPRHAFVDADGDHTCDLCPIQMIPAEKGMSVVDCWFRLYRPEYDEGWDSLSWSEISISGNDTSIIATNLGRYGEEYIVFKSGPKASESVKSGLRMVVTDEYIDFCFTPGIYQFDGGELSIGALDTLTYISAPGTCFKLVGAYEE